MKFIDDLICIFFAAALGALFALTYILRTGGF